jgi:hypothetical protein
MGAKKHIRGVNEKLVPERVKKNPVPKRVASRASKKSYNHIGGSSQQNQLKLSSNC